MTTLTPTLGNSQIDVLVALKGSSTGLTAPAIRDAAIDAEGDYGTRRAHAILARLTELGFVTKEQMSAKVAAANAHESTGRAATHRFKISAEGKRVLKAVARV